MPTLMPFLNASNPINFLVCLYSLTSISIEIAAKDLTLNVFFIEARSTFDPSEYIKVDENAMPELARVNTIFRDGI